MAVVCLGCRAEVSEWAARCPYCRRSLDDAELLPEPEPPAVEEAAAGPAPRSQVGVSPDPVPAPVSKGEDPATSLRPAREARRKLPKPAAVIAAVVLAGALLVTALEKSAAHKNPGGLPDALASERLFLAEAGRTGLYQADGTRLRSFQTMAGIGYIQPLVSRGGVLVYLHNGRAYRTDGTSAARPVKLGSGSLQADAEAFTIFPAADGGIGIELAPLGGPATVSFMTADGGIPTSAPQFTLPSGANVVAELPKGLLIETHGSFSDPVPGISSLWLSIVEARTSAFLGVASAVIGTHGPSVAWTTCPAPRSSYCSLHLLDSSSGAARTIPPPAAYTGYAQSGGAFSPNGRMLAAFVPSQLPGGAMVLRLVVEDLATGQVSVVGPAIPTDTLLVGTATWSVDGHWLYFGGVTGRLHAVEIDRTGPVGHAWALPLPTSVAVIGD